MSFYTENRNGLFPGHTNNVMQGLCERACIQVDKVYDACMQQTQLENQQITVTNLNPANPTYPLTFVSAQSTTGVTTTNTVITRFDDRPNFARVQATVNIPLIVNYVDANGVSGTGTSTISIDEDVILYVPQPSIIPVQVQAFASAVSTIGTYVSGNTFSVTVCVTVILKITAPVDIMVPSYGYCPIPPCTPFTPGDICPGVFELPLFPTAQTPQQQ